MPGHRRSRAAPPWPTARDYGSPRPWLPAVDLSSRGGFGNEGGWYRGEMMENPWEKKTWEDGGKWDVFVFFSFSQEHG